MLLIVLSAIVLSLILFVSVERLARRSFSEGWLNVQLLSYHYSPGQEIRKSEYQVADMTKRKVFPAIPYSSLLLLAHPFISLTLFVFSEKIINTRSVPGIGVARGQRHDLLQSDPAGDIHYLYDQSV